MSNTITLAKSYVSNLDKVYQKEAVTSVLNSDKGLAREGAKAGEIVIPKIDMDGLGDYDRNSGYTTGSANLDWETVAFNYDRGRIFQVDVMDDEETINLAFGQLGAEFMRTKVAPEGDAFTFATLAGLDSIGSATGSYSDGDAVLEAIIEAQNAMDEEEVDDGRYLFINPSLMRAIEALETYKSQQVIAEFAKVIKVPAKRFYTAITLLSGSDDESAGHYTASGNAINFMIVDPGAVLKFDKHVASNIITPEANQSADAYMLKYRKYGLVTAYENKRAGIYVNSVAATA